MGRKDRDSARVGGDFLALVEAVEGDEAPAAGFAVGRVKCLSLKGDRNVR